MTWKTGADLSLSGLRRLRETLLERERRLERLYTEVFGDPAWPTVARGLEDRLDEVRGQLDEISDEIGHLECDAYEERASENLQSTGRRYNLSEY